VRWRGPAGSRHGGDPEGGFTPTTSEVTDHDFTQRQMVLGSAQWWPGGEHMIAWRREDAQPTSMPRLPVEERDCREFNGIQVPTKRLIYSHDDQFNEVPEPILVSIDFLDIAFS
jgi:hypothetical protein